MPTNELENRLGQLVTLLESYTDRSLANKATNDSRETAVLHALFTIEDLMRGFMATNNHLHSRAVLLRSMLEVLADVKWIFVDESETSKRASNYCESAKNLMEALHQELLRTKSNNPRNLQRLSSWTTATIRDRIGCLSKGFLRIYDLLSYSTHSHPGRWILYGKGKQFAQDEDWLRGNALLFGVGALTVAEERGYLDQGELMILEDLRTYAKTMSSTSDCDPSA